MPGPQPRDRPVGVPGQALQYPVLPQLARPTSVASGRRRPGMRGRAVRTLALKQSRWTLDCVSSPASVVRSMHWTARSSHAACRGKGDREIKQRRATRERGSGAATPSPSETATMLLLSASREKGERRAETGWGWGCKACDAMRTAAPPPKRGKGWAEKGDPLETRVLSGE